LERITSVLDQTARDIPVFVRVLGITYDSVDHAALIERHDHLVEAIRTHHRDAALRAWDDHIRSTVGEFSRGYPDAQIERIFDLPLMHHILDHSSHP
jgi:DNA-binding GntR family transcriptional regulator